MGGLTTVDILALLTLLAVVPVGLVVRASWRHRHQPAFRWLFIAMLSAGVWTVARAISLFANSPTVTILFDRVLVFAVSLLAICWFLLAVESVFRRPVSEYVFAVLLAVPVATQLLGLVRPTLLYTADSYVDDRGVFQNTVGPWLAVDLYLFGFGLALSAVAIWTGRALTGRRKHVETSTLMVTGTLIIAAPAVLHTTGLVPEYVDATPVALFVAGGLLLRALRVDAGEQLELGPRRDSAFDVLDEAILIVTDRGVVVDANQRLRDLFGVSSVAGRNVTDVLSDADGLVDALARGTDEWSGTISLGERYFDARLATVEYGLGAEGRLVVLSDVTERREREQRLERQNERLEKFTSTVSHDLRNPLSVARGRVELLSAGTDSPHLEPLERALARMNTLVDETLSLARQGRIVDETDTVSLAAVCERSWRRVDTRDATLTVVDDDRLLADSVRVERVFENLFRNCVEHGGPGVAVRVGLSADGFYVADDGPGVPPDERDEVFGFGETSTTDGTGYGLAIVAEIASAHGWRVDVSASEAGGARFDFSGVTFAPSGE
ncbi:sensor histidine kinase [Haloarcula onubensis]|uniref:histidine kinase n=1 Tax=Haloarcula onubensis TaxID=2950539 RepID=A0ABU2FIR6_9EURY|nr:histidine kinase N-terminal 7TM domain-containing protein [Halomicroarcula sp. S3CR25-11]MDS0280650.1 ATP-binding protein [Halomicroarcula sp. S3CR25-11]